MRFSTTGIAATAVGGTGVEIGVDGATPAALVGISAASFYGPAWLSTSKIVYQNSTSGIQQSYDINTTAFATLASAGSTIIAAGNNVWAYFLTGSGVFTSNGLGPFPQGFLGDVSTDHGELVLVTSSGSLGLTIYDSGGSVLLSLPTVALSSPFNSPCRLRGHVLAYKQALGWTLVDVTGAALTYRVRTDDSIGWMTPVFIGSTLYVLERSTRLTLRPANGATGWIIQDVGHNTTNPDAVSLAADTVRLGWCTNGGESADSLVVGNFVVSTNTLTLSTVIGGVLTPGSPQVLTPTTFQVSAPITSTSGNVPMPRSDHPIANPNGTYTREMSRWMLAVNGTASSAFVAAQTALNVPGTNAFSTLVSGSNVPIVATQPQDTLTVTPQDRLSVTLDPTTKTATLGLGGEATITLTGTQNNVNFSNAATLRCNNASALTITGLPASTAGQRLIIAAINAPVTLTQNGGTPASTGFLLTGSADVTLTAPDQMLVERDATSGRWREVRRAISGSSVDYVVMSNGHVAGPIPMDNGAGSFLYISYLP